MRMSRLLVGAAAAVLLVAYAATPAGAVWDPGLGGPEGDRPQHRSDADQHRRRPGRHRVDRSGQQALRPVGALPDHGPLAPFVSNDESFAGVINATPIGGGTDLKMYCINILTSTFVGVGYELGDWTGANVNNVGFVARLLNDYFPNDREPAALADDNEKAAAVQAAIWYFSDNYVLNTADPLHDAVADIVNAVRTQPPLVQPPPPSLTITPSTVAGSTGTPTGPFTVTVTGASTTAVVAVDKGQMFSDAAGTTRSPTAPRCPPGRTSGSRTRRQAPSPSRRRPKRPCPRETCTSTTTTPQGLLRRRS